MPGTTCDDAAAAWIEALEGMNTARSRHAKLNFCRRVGMGLVYLHDGARVEKAYRATLARDKRFSTSRLFGAHSLRPAISVLP
jgi:hypothetical protein